MIKLTLTQIGTPKVIQTIRGQAEKNYCKAAEYGDKFLNYWVNNTTRNWKIWDVVEVEAVEEREYTAKDGTLKKSHDIKLPKFGNNTEVMKALEEIRNTQTKHTFTLERLSTGLTDIHRAIVKPVVDDYPKSNGPTAFDDEYPVEIVEDDKLVHMTDQKAEDLIWEIDNRR